MDKYYSSTVMQYEQIKRIISHTISALLLFLVSDWFILKIMRISNWYLFLSDLYIFIAYILIYALVTVFFSEILVYPFLKNSLFQRYEFILLPLIFIIIFFIFCIKLKIVDIKSLSFFYFS